MDQVTLDRLREAAGRVLAGEPVLFGYLFGSRATGRTHHGSDVDVAIYLDPSVPPERYLDLALRLASKLGSGASLGDVEVVILNEASLPLAGRAVRERAVIYSRDEPARVRYEGKTLTEFLDFEIHAGPMATELLRRMAERAH
jgi:predicted nucleotidyltransferase